MINKADSERIRKYWISHPKVLKKMHREDFESEEEKNAWIDSQLTKILRIIEKNN